MDEGCGRGGELVLSSKFTLIVMLKVVIYNVSDSGENVFRLGGLGDSRRGTVVLVSAPMVE